MAVADRCNSSAASCAAQPSKATEASYYRRHFLLRFSSVSSVLRFLFLLALSSVVVLRRVPLPSSVCFSLSNAFLIRYTPAERIALLARAVSPLSFAASLRNLPPFLSSPAVSPLTVCSPPILLQPSRILAATYTTHVLTEQRMLVSTRESAQSSRHPSNGVVPRASLSLFLSDDLVQAQVSVLAWRPSGAQVIRDHLTPNTSRWLVDLPRGGREETHAFRTRCSSRFSSRRTVSSLGSFSSYNAAVCRGWLVLMRCCFNIGFPRES